MNQNDYVIKNGKLIGDFESLYQQVQDPWNQSRFDHLRDSRRLIAIKFCEDLLRNCLKDEETMNQNLSKDSFMLSYSKQNKNKERD